jgi:hypothetical protein
MSLRSAYRMLRDCQLMMDNVQLSPPVLVTDNGTAMLEDCVEYLWRRLEGISRIWYAPLSRNHFASILYDAELRQWNREVQVRLV